MDIDSVNVNATTDGRSRHIGKELEGRYMTFKLATEVYGLEILKVREIIGLMDITRVPKTEAHIRGIINLRGKVIPVIDLRLKFGMDEIQSTDQTVIIVVQYRFRSAELTMGILVDEVLEVLNVVADQIEPPPQLGGGSDANNFILGVGKTEERVTFLVDIGKVLSGQDSEQLLAASKMPVSAIETQ